MTPEKMLIALNDIDSRSIQEARADKSPAGRFRGRRIAVILAAVIALVGRRRYRRLVPDLLRAVD